MPVKRLARIGPFHQLGLRKPQSWLAAMVCSIAVCWPSGVSAQDAVAKALYDDTKDVIEEIITKEAAKSTAKTISCVSPDGVLQYYTRTLQQLHEARFAGLSQAARSDSAVLLGAMVGQLVNQALFVSEGEANTFRTALTDMEQEKLSRQKEEEKLVKITQPLAVPVTFSSPETRSNIVETSTSSSTKFDACILRFDNSKLTPEKYAQEAERKKPTALKNYLDCPSLVKGSARQILACELGDVVRFSVLGEKKSATRSIHEAIALLLVVASDTSILSNDPIVRWGMHYEKKLVQDLAKLARAIADEPKSLDLLSTSLARELLAEKWQVILGANPASFQELSALLSGVVDRDDALARLSNEIGAKPNTVDLVCSPTMMEVKPGTGTTTGCEAALQTLVSVGQMPHLSDLVHAVLIQHPVLSTLARELLAEKWQVILGANPASFQELSALLSGVVDRDDALVRLSNEIGAKPNTVDLVCSPTMMEVKPGTGTTTGCEEHLQALVSVGQMNFRVSLVTYLRDAVQLVQQVDQNDANVAQWFQWFQETGRWVQRVASPKTENPWLQSLLLSEDLGGLITDLDAGDYGAAVRTGIDLAFVNLWPDAQDSQAYKFKDVFVGLLPYLVNKDGQVGVAAREEFQDALRDALLAGGGGGYTDAYGGIFEWGTVGLRASWSSGYTDKNFRPVASVEVITLRPRIAHTRYFYGAFQFSLLDLLGPLSEIALRENAHYRDEGKVWANFIAPRLDFVMGSPAFSKRIGIYLGTGVRPVVANEIDEEFAYEFVWQSASPLAHFDLSAGVRFFPW